MDIIGISSQAFTQRLRGTSRQTSGGTDMASSIRYINNTLCDRTWLVLPVTYICLRPIYPFSQISIEQRAQKICKISWLFIKSPSRFLFPQFNYPFIGYQNSWTFRMFAFPFPFPCFKGYRVSEVYKISCIFRMCLCLSLPLPPSYMFCAIFHIVLASEMQLSFCWQFCSTLRVIVIVPPRPLKTTCSPFSTAREVF